MAISGLFTTQGISNIIDADDGEGFKIHVVEFSVSRNTSVLSPSLTAPNAGEFYKAAVSSRIKIDGNTVKVSMTIPQNAVYNAAPVANGEQVKEVYLFGELPDTTKFLMAVGQPTEQIIYSQTGSVTLELQLRLVDVNLTNVFLFTNTQAVELEEHRHDPNSHPEILTEMNYMGMFPDAGTYAQANKGQPYQKMVHFDGFKATNVYNTRNFTADFEGTEGNSITLVFDGVKTIEQVRAAWNADNPLNTVSHDEPNINYVPPAGSVTLAGGSYNLDDGDLVYLAADGKYKAALASSGVQRQHAGFADFAQRVVRGQRGVYDKVAHGFTHGNDLYLSSTLAGKLTDSPTSVKIGFAHSVDTIFYSGVGTQGSSFVDFDAVVTDAIGLNYYPTTQEAIDAVGSGARILVDKFEEVRNTITHAGKRIEFFFSGLSTGWKRYQGTVEVHTISFSQVPTGGTWRIVYGVGLETTDLSYNANAAAIQAAINAIFPLNTCVVTGNYSTGFTVTFSQLSNVPQPYFTDAGINEIQQISLGNIPNNGTVSLNFNGQNTANFAWNDDATLLKGYLEALPNITLVNTSGSFGAAQFTVEFAGVDGNQNQPQMTVNANTLNLSGSPTTVNISTLQQGRTPASNLVSGINAVVITATTNTDGSALGDATCITVGADGTQFSGLGTIQDFTVGIDLNNKTNVKMEMYFANCTTNYVVGTLTPNVDFKTHDSLGLTSRKIRTVGADGDHATLALAYAAANAGDKILVMEDQTISVATVINKQIEIEFVHNAKINVVSNIAGIVLTLSDKVTTRNLKLFINHASSFTTGILITGERGHHEDLQVEVATGTTITNVILLNTGCARAYADGALILNAATVTNKVVDNATTKNNDYTFRDSAGLIYPISTGLYGYDAVVGSAAQVSSGAATHAGATAVQDACNFAGSGGAVLILKGAGFTGNLSLSFSPSIIEGQGYGSTIGSMNLTSSCDNITFNKIRFTDNVVIDNGSQNHILTDFYIDAGKTVTDNNPAPPTPPVNLILGIGL